MFTLVLFLIFEIPIISNAAGIYDNSLMNIDNKNNEKLEYIKTNKIHIFNETFEKIASKYDMELISIFKKNAMIQKIQDKPSKYQPYYSVDAGRGNYIQFINNDEIDAQTLLETEVVWQEIKTDINYLNSLLNKVDIEAKYFLDEYFDEHIDTNYVLITGINNIRQPKSKRNLHQSKNILAGIIYQNDTHNKHQDDKSSGYNSYSDNDELNSAYGGDNKKNSDEQNIFSLIYLWEKYSDIMVGVLIIAILWLVIASLIKFLTRTG